MTNEERKRVLIIRCASKRGDYTSVEDNNFCMDMFKKYPDEYAEMTKEVFERTRPMGFDINISGT